MSEHAPDDSYSSSEDLSQKEHAAILIDPGHLTATGFAKFFRTLERVRQADDEELPNDFSADWLYRNPQYVAARIAHKEAFDAAVVAVASMLEAETKVHTVERETRQELSGYFKARNELAGGISADDFRVLPNDGPEAQAK